MTKSSEEVNPTMAEASIQTVMNFFAEQVRDVTPACIDSTLRVLYAPVSQDPEILQHCRSVLSQDELQKAEQLQTDKDKAQVFMRRAFRRYCGARALGSDCLLSEVQFQETKEGCPYLPALPATSFSFSTCSLGYVAAWSSTHKVGVDIEDPRRTVETIALADTFFAKPEADAVRRVTGFERETIFFQLWTLKEAALKSVGEGLPFGLDTFEFILSPELRITTAPVEYGGAKNFHGQLIDNTDGCAALVMH